MSALAKSLHRVAFYALVGVKDVQLAGEEVVGRWKAAGELRRLEKSLAEDFANWLEDPNDILQFTRFYGPLRESNAPGKQFRFRMSHWRLDHAAFRELWEHRKPKAGTITGLGSFQSGQFQDSWAELGGKLAYRASTLWRFLFLDLLAIPAKRLRNCARPDCQTPHFVARHLGQHYCSPECAEWGQRRWKVTWWHKHGNDWRKKKARMKARKLRKKSQRKRGK